MSYVYVQSEKAGQQGATNDLFTVGFYQPDGEWVPQSDHSKESEAQAKVILLNGGATAAQIVEMCAVACEEAEKADARKAPRMDTARRCAAAIRVLVKTRGLL